MEIWPQKGIRLLNDKGSKSKSPSVPLIVPPDFPGSHAV